MDAVKHDTPKTKVEWVNVIAKRCKEAHRAGHHRRLTP
jgi:hypothetical protein